MNFFFEKIKKKNKKTEAKIANTLSAEEVRLPQFENVVFGGTFDYLHAGHKVMLTIGAITCTKLLAVGLTS